MKNKFFKKLIQNSCSTLELTITDKCQNKCVYCYRHNFHKDSNYYYLPSSELKILLSKIKEQFDLNKFNRIELFGGEPILTQKQILNTFKVLSEFFDEIDVVIPTNGRYISEITIKDVEEILFSYNNLNIFLSISVDGFPAEFQRPLSKFGKENFYNKEINYERLFKLKNLFPGKIGFHPMYDFKNVDIWYDQFKFWYENDVITYNLEIRHDVKDDEIIKALKQLIRIYNDFLKNIKEDEYFKKLNIFYLTRMSKGIGCSAPTTLSININGDITFCHRLIDKNFYCGNIYKGDINWNKLLQYKLYDKVNSTQCLNCSIKDICSGQCLGACYEYWGNAYTPIPSICKYKKAKKYIFYKLNIGNFSNLSKYIKIKELENDLKNENIYNKLRGVL